MTNSDLAALATSAVQLPLNHADPVASRVAAVQAAVRENRTYYIAERGELWTLYPLPVTEQPDAPHKRINPDGSIVEVKADGTEKPAERIERGTLRHLADTKRMTHWAKNVDYSTTPGASTR